MSHPVQRTPGYVGRRLAFIVVWMFVTMFPAGSSHESEYADDPAFVLLVALIALAVIFIPPIIAARQIYRAYANK